MDMSAANPRISSSRRLRIVSYSCRLFTSRLRAVVRVPRCSSAAAEAPASASLINYTWQTPPYLRSRRLQPRRSPNASTPQEPTSISAAAVPAGNRKYSQGSPPSASRGPKDQQLQPLSASHENNARSGSSLGIRNICPRTTQTSASPPPRGHNRLTGEPRRLSDHQCDSHQEVGAQRRVNTAAARGDAVHRRVQRPRRQQA
jgi:hypothetical protein